MSTPLYTAVTAHTHHSYRRPALPPMAEDFAARRLSPRARMAERFCAYCDAEEPHIIDGQQIVFLRTLPGPCPIFTPEEIAAFKADHALHELGCITNLCPDHAAVIARGFSGMRDAVDEHTRASMDALQRLADRYRDLALAEGRDDVAEVLSHVPAQPARTLREALQFFRILHFGVWLDGTTHNTVGRFDVWAAPYFEADLAAGRLTEESALDLLTDFFLSFNLDSDLYFGMQQGDNGQSMMLGGDDGQGGYLFSRLTDLCLEASLRNKLIDPKINLRVSSKTPSAVYRRATELTAAGLGFPQYSNDDVVIPALIDCGYAPEHAANYTVAACWEFIIPAVASDIVNIDAMSYPAAVDRAIHRGDYATMDDLRAAVREEIFAHCANIAKKFHAIYTAPGPFTDLCFGGRDVAAGLDYNNYGVHGVGIATAADSLAAIDKWVFGEKKLSLAELTAAVDADFADTPDLLHLLRYESPKCGVPDGDAAVREMVYLGDCFADGLAPHRNAHGGIYRPGTGSAFNYTYLANKIGASPDGRRRGEPFGANFSPSLFAATDPVSVIRAFTAPDLHRLCNGGPLTMEFDRRLFANPDGIEKTAALVEAYIAMGGHQLQLNAIDRETLLDAREHPERYPNLIVRVWGWSGYFVALDRIYQDHVIARQTYSL